MFHGHLEPVLDRGFLGREEREEQRNESKSQQYVKVFPG
jgi:hypothetical protein